MRASGILSVIGPRMSPARGSRSTGKPREPQRGGGTADFADGADGERRGGRVGRVGFRNFAGVERIVLLLLLLLILIPRFPSANGSRARAGARGAGRFFDRPNCVDAAPPHPRHLRNLRPRLPVIISQPQKFLSAFVCTTTDPTRRIDKSRRCCVLVALVFGRASHR